MQLSKPTEQRSAPGASALRGLLIYVCMLAVCKTLASTVLPKNRIHLSQA